MLLKIQQWDKKTQSKLDDIATVDNDNCSKNNIEASEEEWVNS